MEIKVIIPDDKKNDLTLKRMDLLERKLDQQYKSFIAKSDKTDYLRIIDNLQKSFMTNLDKVMSMNKNIIKSANDNRIQDLRNEITLRINDLKKDNDKGNDDVMLKSFMSKLSNLESAIKNISIPRPNVVVKNNNLEKSFNAILSKMQELIQKSGTRVTPSPS